jgi:hypothetical protein
VHFLVVHRGKCNYPQIFYIVLKDLRITFTLANSAHTLSSAIHMSCFIPLKSTLNKKNFYLIVLLPKLSVSVFQNICIILKSKMCIKPIFPAHACLLYIYLY